MKGIKIQQRRLCLDIFVIVECSRYPAEFMEYSHELLCLVVGVHVITISGILARAHRYAYKHIKSSHAIWRCVESAITNKINLNIFFLAVARYHFCSSIFFALCEYTIFPLFLLKYEKYFFSVLTIFRFLELLLIWFFIFVCMNN